MNVHQLLGKEADSLLGHTCTGIAKDCLTLPGPDYIDRVMTQSDRSVTVLRNLRTCTTTVASGGVATYRSCPSTRASNTRGRLASLVTRLTSIPPTSANWPSKAAVTPSPPP